MPDITAIIYGQLQDRPCPSDLNSRGLWANGQLDRPLRLADKLPHALGRAGQTGRKVKKRTNGEAVPVLVEREKDCKQEGIEESSHQ